MSSSTRAPGDDSWLMQIIVLAALGILVTKIQDQIDIRLGRWRLA